MVLLFETRIARQLRVDRERHEEYVQRFRARCREWNDGDLTTEDLCADAADALDGYATRTLDALRRSGCGGQETSPWIAPHYHESLSRVGAAIRDEVEDASARHAVAQRLQERVLRAELLFRHAMPSCRASQAKSWPAGQSTNLR